MGRNAQWDDEGNIVFVSNALTHKINKVGFCLVCGMDAPEEGEWVPTCETVQASFGE